MVNGEPVVNISGGADGGGAPLRITDNLVGTRAEEVIDRLGALYWKKAYGGQDAFTCLIRTILSQNTSDVASQPAFDNLIDRYGNTKGLVESLADATVTTLAETIQSAGLYNQKAATIIEIATTIRADFGEMCTFNEFVESAEPDEVRTYLLGLKGVGPKTADCVLLFAGGRSGIFPVDTHVHRIYRRLGIATPDADHETVRQVLEAQVPGEKCGFGHTTSIQFGREYCSARRPICIDDIDACPLADVCDRVGVDFEKDTVIDPKRTLES